MIPALDKRGPERIITIKAGNYQLIGKIVARCAEHLDEFLRRSIPLRKSSFSYFSFENSLKFWRNFWQTAFTDRRVAKFTPESREICEAKVQYKCYSFPSKLPSIKWKSDNCWWHTWRQRRDSSMLSGKGRNSINFRLSIIVYHRNSFRLKQSVKSDF